MSTGEQDLDATVGSSDETEGGTPETGEKRKLGLEVEISDVGPCKKHVKVAVARDDIDRQFDESLGEMTREAAVPGFRPGHAPRRLVERRFRKQVAGQVKQALLMTALEQLDEDYDLDPIAPPNLDIE